MYAFRKPFAAAEFDGVAFWGIDYKVALILSQVAGYTLSKFIGIRVIAEMPRRHRAGSLIALILFAESALIGFALTPPPYNCFFMFLNGLPLGMVWGLVFAYLEGRRSTEILAVSLSASFIAASGVVKGIGLYTIESWGTSEFWMPAVTGGLFLPPIMLLTWLLGKVPPPSELDQRQRTERRPMSTQARWACLQSMTGGLALLVFAHMILTALRDYRDKFTTEILTGMEGGRVEFITKSEVYVMFVVLAPMACLMLLRSHSRAVAALHGLMIGGFICAGVSTLALRGGGLGLDAWFILVGIGLYLAYVPFHSLLFDRLVALYRRPGNAGFLIYIADATGYLSSVLILLFKEFGANKTPPLEFFCTATLVSSAVGGIVVALALIYFLVQQRSLGGTQVPAS